MQKKRKFNDRIMNVEYGSFTPLIFTVNGGVGPEAQRFHKHVADRIADKTGEKYHSVMQWIRCKLRFIILRASLTCLRGSRPRKNALESEVAEDISFAIRDTRLTF